MKFWQMGFLLVIYVVCFVWYLASDLTFDGKMDQPFPFPLLMLMLMMSFGTVWYYFFARRAHMYVR